MKNKIIIDSDAVKNAYKTMLKYKEGKRALEKRIIENEEWFKMRYTIGHTENSAIKQSSAWLFNSIINKHADAMESYPEPNVLPREESDTADAETLSSILPVILEQRNFEQTYSDVWWYKLKTGTGVYGVLWNSALENGLGDVDICQMDILNLFWEPGIKNIEQSKNIFYATAVDKDELSALYPSLGDAIEKTGSEVESYIPENGFVCDNKALVIDWYYKRNIGGKQVLHYCKFVGDQVIFASENEEAYKYSGFYNHGMYPIVFDTMFVTEGTPAGFGYIDAMKGCQTAIDRLDEIILKNAIVSESPRWFISDAAGINEDEYADWTKPFVHVTGRVDDQTVKQVDVRSVSESALNLLQFKVDELKETSGNRDFSQGGTMSGVTAASAIQALQEAGNKLSRDMIKSSFRAYSKICTLIIELIRQFYSEPRTFRITGENGNNKFLSYNNESITQKANSFYAKKPVFDIVIVPQKQNPYQKAEQNALAKELFNIGMLSEERKNEAVKALKIMDFYGRDKLISMLSQSSNDAIVNRIIDNEDV